MSLVFPTGSNNLLVKILCCNLFLISFKYSSSFANFIGLGHEDFDSFCKDRNLRVVVMRRVLYDEITILINDLFEKIHNWII